MHEQNFKQMQMYVYSHVQAANEILTDTYEKMANNQLMFCSVYVCTCTYTFTFSPSLLRCVHVHIHNRKSVSNTDLHILIQSFLHTVSQGMDTATCTYMQIMLLHDLHNCVFIRVHKQSICAKITFGRCQLEKHINGQAKNLCNM